MSLNRKGTWLAAWVLMGMLGGLSASAQGLRDADIFAPAEPSHYGGGVRANEGFFFTYDALVWTASPPKRASFGNTPDPNNPLAAYWGAADTASMTQGTTMDTSFMQSYFTGGQRIEVGHIYEHAGWLFSYMMLHPYGQDQGLYGVQALFADQQWGAANLPHLYTDYGAGQLRQLPVYFDNAILSLSTKIWGTEANILLRTHPGPRGGIFEWFFGARYIEFHEDFDVSANGTLPTSSLADTTFSTTGYNNIIGPQIGLRWFTTNDRWQFSTEGKFVAGWNNQNIHQNGVVGSDLNSAIAPFPRQPGYPLAMVPTSVSYSAFLSEFSPVGELRVEGKYQVTKNIAFRAGWNGMYIGQLARPSRMVNYELGQTHVLGILTNKNNDQCFLQGASLGIEINR